VQFCVDFFVDLEFGVTGKNFAVLLKRDLLATDAQRPDLLIESIWFGGFNRVLFAILVLRLNHVSRGDEDGASY
jgi:hypothetical protein